MIVPFVGDCAAHMLEFVYLKWVLFMHIRS